jgi:hypothetical protein
MLGLLPRELRELRLLGVRQLADRDLAALCRFPRLRELALHSIGNERVSHAALRVRGAGGASAAGARQRGAGRAGPPQCQRARLLAHPAALPSSICPGSPPALPAAPRSPWRRCSGWRC